MPADVNDDGVVAPVDALLVVRELRETGFRCLEPPAVSAAPAFAAASQIGAEGERPSHAYIDVNGDGYLSHVDAFLVVTELRGEGEPDPVVQFRLETTDLGGTPISSVVQGDPFVLEVYVGDTMRPPPDLGDPEYRGVFQAYVDVTFDDALVTALGPFSFGPDYQEQTSGSLAPGLVDEAGGTQTGFALPPLGPLGDGEFLLFSVPFDATTPGTVTFASDPADLAIFHDVTLFEPTNTVPAEDIVYGTTSLTINEAPVVANPDTFTVDEDSDNVLDVLGNDFDVDPSDPLIITSVGIPDRGGTVVNNVNHLLYTPPTDFFGTETFTYTIDDGLGNTDEAAVTVTVIGLNDPPEAKDDSGPGFTTDEDTVLRTGNVLGNDKDVEGDALSVSSFNKAGTRGLVTNNGDGTFGYNPNGQFAYLTFGQQATDSFTYTVTDGNDGFDTATVTVTITAAPPAAGDITGFVYADVDNDGVKDAVERAIGGVEVRLEGTDIFGSPVWRSARTDAQGRYVFPAVFAGTYQLIEVQPPFFLDGIDTVNGVYHTGPNDRVAITPDVDLACLNVNFGERSLYPDFINIADSLNTALREGIVVAFDAQGKQLWYSLLDGWEGEGVTSVTATFSSDGSTATLSVSTAQGGPPLVFYVPTAPAVGKFRVKGETSQGRVVQFIGPMADFQS